MKCRSENGYVFLGPGLNTGVENGIFWSEVGAHPHQTFQGVPPRQFLGQIIWSTSIQDLFKKNQASFDANVMNR